MLEWLRQPWPWYVAGPLIGLTVPLLLIMGNKHFGISSNLRHICAACLPAKIPFFQYDWKREVWNLFFSGGILLGAVIAMTVLRDPNPIQVAPSTQEALTSLGVKDFQHLLPTDIFGWDHLLTIKGFAFMIMGGLLIGFGTRWGGGCTSGHAIMGLSTLQWPSLVATISFMAGGFALTHLVLPLLLRL